MQSFMPTHCFLFEIQIIKKRLYGSDKLSGLSRNGPQDSNYRRSKAQRANHYAAPLCLRKN